MSRPTHTPTRTAPGKQQGAALLVVVILFLLMLPILIATFMNNNVSGTQQGVSSSVRSAASDAGGRALSALRLKIDAALVNGPLEYQSAPAWFIGAGKTVDVRSSGFWSTCQANGLCVDGSVDQPIGTGTNTTAFTVNELVTPTGVTDSMICGQDGFIAVFYNIFIHTQASNIPADGGHTLQSVYRSCQKF